jgi:hypothetical protein
MLLGVVGLGARLAVVLTEGFGGRLRLLAARLSTSSFAYFIFGRKIILAFRAVRRRDSNHCQCWELRRTLFQYGGQLRRIRSFVLVEQTVSYTKKR